MTESNTRITLTTAELNTPVGQELSSLLHELSADGMVSREECDRLREWLESHATVDLQCRPFLSTVVDTISHGGEITEDELDTLALAIERVLPANLRLLATLKRKEHRAARRASLQAQKAEDRAAEKAGKQAARELARPLDRANFIVAGALRSAERREACESLSESETVVFEREPDNVHDENAILVLRSNDAELGYIPRDDAWRLARLLDQGAQYQARIKKLLESRSGHTLPVVVATFYRAGAPLPGQPMSMLSPKTEPVVQQLAAPSEAQPNSTKGTGCLTVLVVAVVLASLILVAVSAV